MYRYFASHWTRALMEIVNQSEPMMMVTIVKVEGSAPRKPRCRMFVLEHQVIETIGGGNLEFEAIELARKMLRGELTDDYKLELYGLGPALNQCCGGAVTLAFEKINSMPHWLLQLKNNNSVNKFLVSDFTQTHVNHHLVSQHAESIEPMNDLYLVEALHRLNPAVVIFGAGHVGYALVEVLSRLPFKVIWVDERDDALVAPDCIEVIYGRPTLEIVKDLPENALNLVMTHSHDLDEDICYHYLSAKQFRYLGVIGSKTKSARFRHRLRDRGIDKIQLLRLTSPIGIADVVGNTPPEIAISVAAQLLSIRDSMKLNDDAKY